MLFGEKCKSRGRRKKYLEQGEKKKKKKRNPLP